VALNNLLEMDAGRKDNAYCLDWKRLYHGALFETDASKTRARIVDAQIAVLKRATELIGRPCCREHQELDDAWRFLHLLEKEPSTEQEVS